MRYRLLYMLLLLLAPQVMTAQNYEYWLDNDYAGRVSKYGELGEVSFEVDVSMLNPGIHYLNCRGRQQKSVTAGNGYDAWGTIKRTMFYVIDTKNSEQPVRVEYWLDSDYAGRVSEATSGGAVAIEKSLSELTSGIHYLNVRSLGAAGQWGTIKRTMFYVDHSVKSFANVRCWIDEAPATAVTQKVEDGTVSLSIDISELNAGDHTLYVQGMGSDGDFADIRSFAFQNSTDINEPANQRISLQDVPFRSYTGWGADAQVVGAADCAWVLNEPTGVPYGDGSVINRADLSHFSKLRVVASEGAPRFLLNRDMDEGQWSEDENESHLIDNTKGGWSEKYFSQETTTEGEVYTVDLKQIKNDKGFVYLHAIKGANWADVTVSSMEVELDGDPQVSIAVNGEGTVGWSTPTSVGEVGISNQSEVITTGFDSELNLTFTPNTGYHLLHVIVNDINDYVNQVTGNSLTLHITQDTNIRVVFEMDTDKVPLTADNFYKWDGWGPLAEIIDQGECQYVLGEPAEIPYGDPNVKDYVDLSSYSRLEVTVEEGTPRFLFNRECENGLWNADETKSHLIESTQEGWSSKYFSQSGNVWSVDLKQMVADKGFAHLHGIKAPWNTQITVTKMELVENGDIVLPEAYAVLSEGNTVLTFYYDVNKSSHDGAMSVGPFSSGGARGWDSNASNITKVEFDKSFANCLTLTSTANWFAGCDHLTTINGTRRIKTADVAEMWCMFLGCSSLTSLDLSSFNTAKVSAIQQMFFGCSALNTVYVGSGWSNENMSYNEAVFEGCNSLVGGYGTAYDASSIDYTYAHIDEGSSNPGYFTGREPLTPEMIFVWDGFGKDAQKKYVTAGAYYLGKSTDIPYGDSDVVNFADLSSYSRLEVLVTAGSPRFLFNRDETDGQPSENEAESHLIDSGHEGCMTWASKYFTSVTTEGGTLWSVNLKQMVEDKGFAHLHAIKGTGDSNITVTKMELFVAQNTAFEPEPYAVLSDNNTVLTFYYDNKKAERNGIAIGSYGPGNDEPWYENRTTLTTAVFDESFANDTTLTSTAYWFHECIKLTEIKGLEYLKTDKVTDMRNMFYGCSKLTTLDVSHLKTGNVTNMNLMFYYCSGLTSLDVTGFNTANVTDMGSMFNNCSGLKSLDISSFKTEKVKDMIQMFYQCYNLTTIYAGNDWSTASVTADYGYHMFTDCTALVGGMGTAYDENHVEYTYAHIDGGSSNPGYFTPKGGYVEAPTFTWNADELTMTTGTEGATIYYTLTDGVTSTPTSTQYTSPITVTSDVLIAAYAEKDGMARSMTTVLDYPYTAWTQLVTAIADAQNVSAQAVGNENVTDNQRDSLTNYISIAQGMYIARIDSTAAINQMTTDLVTMTETIRQLVNAENEPYAVLSNENTVLTFYYDKKKTERNGMSVGPFSSAENRGWNDNASSITSVVFDPSFANETTLTSTEDWFFGLYNLTAIEGIRNLNTSKVKSMSCMFYDCSSLTSLDLTGFNTENVISMSGMFSDCIGLTDLNFSSFNTQNVTGMGQMFFNCKGLTELNLTSFDTQKVTNMDFMFEGCRGLTNLNVTSFNTANVTSMSHMFAECTGLTSLDVRNFNTQNVTDMRQMFTLCWNLTTLDLSSFNTQKVMYMTEMFNGCGGLNTIYVSSSWSTAAIDDGSRMFLECSNLLGGDGTTFSADHVDYTYAHIDGGPDNPGYLTKALSMGDANGDGSINIADAVATVTNILGQPADGNFYKYAADMNNDSFIDIFDVTMIVNAVFDANTPAPALTRGSIDYVPVEAIRLTADANHIYMDVDQAQQYTAFQFDIDLPESTELVDVSLSGNTDHKLSFVKRGDNQYRVVGLSMNNEVFRSANGHLIQLQVSNMAGEDNVKFSNVLFVTPAGKTITGISDCLNATMTNDDAIYNLQGEKLGTNKQQLGKGIYIINHKKVIIK